LDPLNELGDYRCDKKTLRFLFCKNCAVQCFFFEGEGEVVTRTDIPGREGEEVKVWRPKKEGWKEYRGSDDYEQGGPWSYMSVNALALEARQEGLDLREWHEEKRIHYVDALDWKEEDTNERPHIGGTY